MSGIVLQKVIQTRGHCGPATLEMLFSFHGVELPQNVIAAATGVPHGIMTTDGCRIYELDRAVKRLSRKYVMLAKYNAGLEDLTILTEEIGLPIGVEWQGMFVNIEGNAYEESIGHYSVVIGVNQSNGVITMLDPDNRSALVSGVVPVADFTSRWWALNDIPVLNQTQTVREIRNDRLLFAIVSQQSSTPLVKLGLQPVSIELMWTHVTHQTNSENTP